MSGRVRHRRRNASRRESELCRRLPKDPDEDAIIVNGCMEPSTIAHRLYAEVKVFPKEVGSIIAEYAILRSRLRWSVGVEHNGIVSGAERETVSAPEEDYKSGSIGDAKAVSSRPLLNSNARHLLGPSRFALRIDHLPTPWYSVILFGIGPFRYQQLSPYHLFVCRNSRATISTSGEVCVQRNSSCVQAPIFSWDFPKVGDVFEFELSSATDEECAQFSVWPRGRKNRVRTALVKEGRRSAKCDLHFFANIVADWVITFVPPQD